MAHPKIVGSNWEVLWASFVGPTKVRPCCWTCWLHENWTNRDELCFEARWSSKLDLLRHLKSDAYKRLLLWLSSSPPVIEFFGGPPCLGSRSGGIRGDILSEPSEVLASDGELVREGEGRDKRATGLVGIVSRLVFIAKQLAEDATRAKRKPCP